MKRDGKDKFYRKVNLDTKSSKAVKWYNEVVDLINKESVKEVDKCSNR